jgi:hypothetical protein
VGAIVLLSVLALLLLLLAAFAAGAFISARQLQAELDKIRAAGEPVTTADLDAFYAYPPKDRDTTQLWLDAFAVLGSPEYQSDAKSLPYVGDGDAPPSAGEPWPQLDAAEAFLTKYREALEKMHRAMELGGEARYPISFADGAAALSSHADLSARKLRGVVRLLQLESDVQSHRTNLHATARSLRTILAAAGSLKREPLLFSQLVRKSINDVACSQIERLLPVVELLGDDLARLDQDLAAIDEQAAFRAVLLGERAVGVQVYDNPAALDANASVVLRWGALRTADETAYLQLMANFIDASESKKLPLLAAVSRAQDKASASIGSSNARWRYPTTVQALSAIQRFIDVVGRAQGRQAATRSAIAIERFRRSQGQMPKTLAELVPEFLDQPPVDPFDGAPLRFKSDATGYKVYSIGPDSIDQGGELGEEEQELDIVFEVSFETHTGAGGSPRESEQTEPTPGREKSRQPPVQE